MRLGRDYPRLYVRASPCSRRFHLRVPSQGGRYVGRNWIRRIIGNTRGVGVLEILYRILRFGSLSEPSAFRQRLRLSLGPVWTRRARGGSIVGTHPLVCEPSWLPTTPATLGC